jgi:hypothetical protein
VDPSPSAFLRGHKSRAAVRFRNVAHSPNLAKQLKGNRQGVLDRRRCVVESDGILIVELFRARAMLTIGRNARFEREMLFFPVTGSND